jgi:hypothetical protein
VNERPTPETDAEIKRLGPEQDADGYYERTQVGAPFARRLEQQRDELLKALELVVSLSDRKHDAWDKARAAIAAVKGSQ